MNWWVGYFGFITTPTLIQTQQHPPTNLSLNVKTKVLWCYVCREKLMHKNNDWGYHVKRINVELMQRETRSVCPMYKMKIQDVAVIFSTRARPTYTCMFRSENTLGSSHFTFNILRRVEASYFLQRVWKTFMCVICLSTSTLDPTLMSLQVSSLLCAQVLKFHLYQISTQGYDASPALTSSLTIM